MTLDDDMDMATCNLVETIHPKCHAMSGHIDIFKAIVDDLTIVMVLGVLEKRSKQDGVIAL